MEQNKCCCGEKQTIRSEEQKKSLLNRLKRIELLANHIRSCVVRDIHEGRDEVVDELVATIQKLMK